jgi:ubiquitin carboxyl-terminal hydrolase 25/28
MLKEANDTFRILAEVRGSEKLWNVWQAGKQRVMNPDRADDMLEVLKDVGDAMLITCVHHEGL